MLKYLEKPQLNLNTYVFKLFKLRVHRFLLGDSIKK